MPASRSHPVDCRAGRSSHAWLVEADLDTQAFVSNTFEIEWPPKSGKIAAFPEVDRAAYFEATIAFTKINAGQRALLTEAIGRLTDA